MSGALVIHRRWSRAGTTSLFLGHGGLAGTWAANIPRIQSAHGLSDTALGSVLLVFGLGAIAAMAMTGRFAGRIPAARLSALAGLTLAVLFPLMAVAPGWPALLALSVAIGAASGTTEVGMNAYAAQLEQRSGEAMMSSFHAGWSLGGLGGAMLSGVLAGYGWSLPATLATASVAVAAASLAACYLPSLEGAAPPPATFRLPSRALAGVCLLAGLAFELEGSVADWSGVYLSTVIGASAAWATTGYSAFASTMVVGRLAGDAIVSRLGPVRVVRLGSALAIVGLSIALALPNRWAVDGGLVLVGAGLANVVPSVFSAAGRMAGTAGVAMASAVGYGSLLVAPPLIGNLADAIGLRLALTVLLLAVGALFLLAKAVAGRPAGAD